MLQEFVTMCKETAGKDTNTAQCEECKRALVRRSGKCRNRVVKGQKKKKKRVGGKDAGRGRADTPHSPLHCPQSSSNRKLQQRRNVTF